MKNNYKIKRNLPKLSSEEIAKHRDFDALLQEFEKVPVSEPLRTRIRPMYIYIGAAAAALVGLVFFFTGASTGNNYDNASNAYFAAKEYVASPIQDAQASFASYKVTANQGGVYEYKSGSRLVVPAAAFVDDRGALIEGEVKILYREHHDFVDIFLSGIPMTYDSAGTRYTLESAGMMEIYAEQNGQKVKMAPGKSIDVELVSTVNAPPQLNVPPSYNIYKLDKTKKNWIYQDLDRMQYIDELPSNVTLDENDPLYEVKKAYADKLELIQLNITNELAKIESSVPMPVEPLKPKKAKSSDHVFALDFNDLKNAIDDRFLSSSEISETEAAERGLAELYREYEQMLWQISPKSNISPQQFQSKYSEVDGIRIKKANERDYEFTLINGDQATQVIVNPVLTSTDYEKALAVFNRKFAEYQTKVAEREATLAGKKQAVRDAFAAERAKEEKAYQDRLAQLQDNNLNAAATEYIIKRKVINRFRATEMGIWNVDRPIPPSIKNMMASFQDKNGRKFEHNTAYLVDKSHNTVSKFYAGKNTPLHFNRNSDNLLWLLTEDNKIAVFRPEDFKRINQPKGSYTFEMTVIDKEIKSEADVREVLYF